jgi:WD40 repeat protein
VSQYSSSEATALAFSSDGRWLALADRHEQIFLVERMTAHITAQVEGGEQTFSVLFDPTSRLLASACSFQGGGHIRLDRISDEGQLFPVHELPRSNTGTPANAFVDSLIHLAFSPDGRLLALFESSAIYHDARPQGWRGDIVLYSVETGLLQWQTSIDSQVTSDTRSLKHIGSPMGFFTELIFVSDGEVACGASRGLVLFYAVSTGKLTRSIDLHTNASVRSLSLDKDGALLWVILSDGKLTPVSLPVSL